MSEINLTNVMKVNRATIIGAISSMDIVDDFNAKNVPVKRGTITVRVGESDIVLQVYLAETYNSGKANSSYKLLEEAQIGSEFRFDCQLSENKFVPEDREEVVRSYRIRLQFINKLSSLDVAGATFEYGGVVLSDLKEVVNRQDEVYRLDIMIGQPAYRSPSEVDTTPFESFRFNVDLRNTDVIQAVRNNFNKQDTVKITGTIVTNVTTTEEVEEALFGAPIIKTYQNVNTLFNIEGANIVPESAIYSQEQIDFLAQNTRIAEAKLIEERASKGKAKTSASNVAKAKSDPLGDLFG